VNRDPVMISALLLAVYSRGDRSAGTRALQSQPVTHRQCGGYDVGGRPRTRQC
jgi:hypothetical protein